MAINTVINTNVMALTAHRNLGTVGNRQNKANQRLSSGKKINSAADDAAGLAISEKMKAQIKGLDMASKNSEDAISLIQTAEGSLTEVNNMLTRIRELTVQAGNDTNQGEDRVKIAEEVAQLLTEIDSISERTEFNEKKLTNGNFKDGHFQIGANSGQSLNLTIDNMNVDSLGLDAIKEVFGAEIDQKALDSLTIDGNSETATKKPAAAQVLEIDYTGAAGGKTFEFTTADGKTITTKAYDDANDNKGAIEQDLNTQLKDYGYTAKVVGNKITITANEVGKGTLKGGTGVTESNPGNDDTYTFNLTGKGNIEIDGKKIEITGKVTTVDELNAAFEAAGLNYVASGADLANVEITSANGYKVNSTTVENKKGEDFSNAIDNIDSALKVVTTQRAKLGATQNRLEYTINNLNTTSENLSASKSRIEDTDMAKEMMNLTSANVLQQAATSILAQANQAPNNITQLLG